MKSIIVMCDDPKAKAAMEARIEAEGFTVERNDYTPEPRGELTVQTTIEATGKLMALDETLVGTPHYMGVAYFWSREYRHYLRDATAAQRCAVHDAWLKAGLELTGDSNQHMQLITNITGKR